jgi:hypothetical protein
MELGTLPTIPDTCPVCILHVGKAGGTALGAVIDQHRRTVPGANVRMYPHEDTLPALAQTEPDAVFVFFVREPLSRFVSGFNSRLRRGRPRYDSAWSAEEAEIFAWFSDANTFAEALSSSSREERQAAEAGLQAIRHLRLGYRHYLGSVQTLEALRPRIAFIGRQEFFEEDLDRLKCLLGIDPAIVPPSDDFGAHRNPATLNKLLSARAEDNVRAFCQDEFTLHRWCIDNRAAVSSAGQRRLAALPCPT